MALDGRLLARARERLAQRRKENAALLDRREAEIYRAIPQVRRLDAQLRELVGEVVSLAARGGANDKALKQIESKSLDLCAQKAELLVAHGYPYNYLEDPAACSRCRDTGYLPNGAMCQCLKAAYEEERAKELSSVVRLGEENFGDFDLNYYTGSAREYMELNLNLCRNYALEFGPGSANLLFQGGTGLGKTFLSGCVARTVSSRGFSVVYETAQGAFSAFEEQKFSRDEEMYATASEKVDRILSCDLLVLDDLGTELTTSFTQSALYNILNSRLGANRKTIVSTNLSDEELAARYIPQIVSRLNGEFDTLLFQGRDIRAIKKEQRYR